MSKRRKPYSSQSEKYLREASKQYNLYRRRAKAKGIEITVPMFDVRSALRHAETTEQVRQIAQSLKDYRRPEDFAQSDKVSFQATRGEVRTFQRLRSAQVRRQKKESEALRAQLSKQTTADAMKTLEKISRAEALPTELSAFRKRQSFLGAISSRKREALKIDVRAVNDTKYRFVYNLEQISELYGVDTKTLQKSILKIPARVFAAWWVNNGDLDLGGSPFGKVNEVLHGKFSELPAMRALQNLNNALAEYYVRPPDPTLDKRIGTIENMTL